MCSCYHVAWTYEGTAAMASTEIDLNGGPGNEIFSLGCASPNDVGRSRPVNENRNTSQYYMGRKGLRLNCLHRSLLVGLSYFLSPARTRRSIVAKCVSGKPA